MLLATKLYNPLVRPNAVQRGRLLEQLDAGLQGKLTLISAPAAILHTSAYLYAIYGWTFVLSGQTATGLHYLQMGEKVLQNHYGGYIASEERPIRRREVQGHFTAIRAFAAQIQGDIANAIELSHQAREELPVEAKGIRCVMALSLGMLFINYQDLKAAQRTLREAIEIGQSSVARNLYAMLGAFSGLAGIEQWYGQLQEAIERHHQAIRLEKDTSNPIPAIAENHLFLTQLYYLRNELDLTAKHVEQGLRAALPMGRYADEGSLYVMQAKLSLLAGEWAEAQSLLDRVKELTIQHDVAKSCLPNHAEAQLQLYILRKNETALAQWVAAHRGTIEVTKAQGVEKLYWRQFLQSYPKYIALARALLVQEQSDEAADWLNWLLKLAEAIEHIGAQIDIHILLSMADGPHHMEEALRLAAPGNFIRPFLDQGEGITPLLRQTVAQNRQAEFATHLLGLIQESEESQSASTHSSSSTPLLEPLTDRERQVLRLLVAGLSSTEVAKELILAVSTIRSYIKNIYGKLGVHNRAEAVLKAKELELV